MSTTFRSGSTRCFLHSFMHVSHRAVPGTPADFEAGVGFATQRHHLALAKDPPDLAESTRILHTPGPAWLPLHLSPTRSKMLEVQHLNHRQSHDVMVI